MSRALSGDLGANEIVRLLDLAPHPEGGWYRQTFRDDALSDAGRSAGTAIYYLLEAEQISAWHRIDAAEIWHFYAGAPLSLTLSPPEGGVSAQVLGPDLRAGCRPQRIVPAGWWQTAVSLGAWTLVGCTVAPGFVFSGFEKAPPDLTPGG